MLAEDIAGFYDDPLGYVMYNFPWDSEPSIQMVELEPQYKKRFPGCKYGPDVWACEFLDQLGEEIRARAFDGRTPVDPIQFSTASGHGIGKSALTAMLIKFIMDTRPFCKGTVTAGKAEQLKSKTWAELVKWHNLSLTVHWFDITTGRGAMAMFSTQKDPTTGKSFKETWRCDAHTCKEENADSFAGQHAANSTSFYIFDEASAVPNKIYEVREGGLTDGEPMSFDFGNPTENTGMFYENCEGRFKHRYIVRKIDSRDVKITNKKQIARWIEDYGLNSDFVKVRVRGMFPSGGTLQFIPTDSVREARKRATPKEDRNAPLVLGVDVARLGVDESVIWPRWGQDARTFGVRRYRELNSVQLADRIVEVIREFEDLGMPVSAVFIDMGNTGAAVYDILQNLGYGNIIGIWFGGKPTDGTRYRYKRDEMADRMKQDLAEDLVLPDVGNDAEDIEEQFTQRQFGYTANEQAIQLESKTDMRSRGLSSPDLFDALSLTYAQQVPRLDVPHGSARKSRIPRSGGALNYDPLEREFG